MDRATPEAGEFKRAAIAKTVAYPLDPWFQLGDPRILLALVLLPTSLRLARRLGTSAD